jgi:hypothetical protein
MKRISIAAVAAALIATPAWAVSDATGTTNDEYVSMFNDRLAHPVAHILPIRAPHMRGLRTVRQSGRSTPRRLRWRP